MVDFVMESVRMRGKFPKAQLVIWANGMATRCGSIRPMAVGVLHDKILP